MLPSLRANIAALRATIFPNDAAGIPAMSFPSAYFTQLRHLNRDRLGQPLEPPVSQHGGWYRMFHCTKVTLCKPGGAIERGGLKSRVDLNRGRPTASQAWIDDGEAAYNAAMLTANGVGGPKDPIAAIQLLRKAAFLDVVKAQVALGHLYRQGSSSVTKNDDEAFRWYEKAALISAVR